MIRKQPASEIESSSDCRERIETLLIELSTRFIGLPADQVDGEIREAQRRICDYLGFDRSSLWEQPADDSGTLIMTHVYQRQNMPVPPPKPNAGVMFPWILDQLRKSNTVAISKRVDFPPEAALDRDQLEKYGTRSVVVVPFTVGHGKLGALTFASAREREDWPESILKWLRLVAEVFANALARARSDRALRESEARLQLTVESAGAGLWVLEADNGRIWCSERMLELLRFPPEEELDFERFLALIHPGDRDSVRRVVERALQSSEVQGVEYRAVLPDGSIRWIAARGRGHHDTSGRPERVMGVSVDITQRKQAEEDLRHTLDEIQRLRDELQQQNVYLKQEVKQLHGYTRLIGQSQALKGVLVQAEQVASTDSTVLMLGETGTGKELVASAIHQLSPRRDNPMVRVNCSAMPASLVESELFGREKGAYTGASSRQIGRFELADKSTLFLDEIGELPHNVQIKLLRVLQEGQIERLGSPRPVSVDVRIIAATNMDLERAVREGRFREDLYYRLNVFPITVPPLRERREDIPALVNAFVSEFSGAFGKKIEFVARESMDALKSHHWPGNVRELRNVVERAMILAKGPKLRIDLPAKAALGSGFTMEEVNRDHIRRVLDMTEWRIRGKNGAAELLGLKPTTLESRMAKLGIRRRAADST